MAMMGLQGLPCTVPKTRICRLVNDWIEWSDGAERQSQDASVVNSFVSRARSLSTSHSGSPDGGQLMDWQGPDTETASILTPADSARAGEESEACQPLYSALVQDMQSKRERSASIPSSISTAPSMVPDPDYLDDPSPAKKTFGILKEHTVSLSGARIPLAQPSTSPPKLPKTKTHMEIVEKELTFSQRSLAYRLAGSGRSVSGPAQPYFSMMQRTAYDDLSTNTTGFDNRDSPADSVGVDLESTQAPDDEDLSMSEDD